VLYTFGESYLLIIGDVWNIPVILPMSAWYCIHALLYLPVALDIRLTVQATAFCNILHRCINLLGDDAVDEGIIH